jgi:hypothetical protein
VTNNLGVDAVLPADVDGAPSAGRRIPRIVVCVGTHDGTLYAFGVLDERR